jgi:cell wall-associated NlpC family hydrolase
MNVNDGGNSLPTIQILEPGGGFRGPIALGPYGLTIGRADTNDVVLDHPLVSLQHARLDWDGEHVHITDLGTNGGTILGNLVLAAREPHVWDPGTWLSLGPYWLELSEPSLAGQTRPMATVPPVRVEQHSRKPLLGTLLEYGVLLILVFTALLVIGDRNEVSAADIGVGQNGEDTSDTGSSEATDMDTMMTATAQALLPTATVWLPTVTATLQPNPTNPPTPTLAATSTPLPTATVPAGEPTSTPIPTATPPITATSPPPPPSGAEGSALPSVDVPSDAIGVLIVQYATSVLGHPYVWGGEVVDNALRGTDCSGLVWWAHHQAGVPWALAETRTTAADQYERLSVEVPSDQKAAGDAVFYTISSRLDHVALYTGNGEMVHAPKPGDNVKFAQWDLWNPPWVTGVGRMY